METCKLQQGGLEVDVSFCVPLSMSPNMWSLLNRSLLRGTPSMFCSQPSHRKTNLSVRRTGLQRRAGGPTFPSTCGTWGWSLGGTTLGLNV